ncbi:MAG TPA: hypothetical protein VFQ78_14125 [Candidatus Udaeobacter sp.]|nr:hypothetical protein [Candidatus Udaeobacter sp.]
MKTAVIITLIFALAGCATNQSSVYRSRPDPRLLDKSEHPELAGLTQEQIRRLMWRVQ